MFGDDMNYLIKVAKVLSSTVNSQKPIVKS